MAKNLAQYDGTALSVICSDPTLPLSGQPVRVGVLTGVAQTDEATGSGVNQGGQNPTGYTSVDFAQRVWNLSVEAVTTGDAGSAVALYDSLYYHDGDADLTKDPVGGYFFGIAMGTVTSGATALINVLHVPQGAGTIGAGVGGVASGYKLARGVAAVTGTATVVTGLTTVVAVIATAADDPDGVALAMVSATIGDQAGSPAAGSVILKAWKVTATGNATLIAATAAKNINWVAVGS